MSDEPPSRNALLTILAGIGSLCVAALGVLLWYQLKLASMSTWSEASILFMPILIGVAVGWIARRCADYGSSGLGGLAVLVTLLAGVGGLALQHRIEVDFFLRRMAEAGVQLFFAGCRGGRRWCRPCSRCEIPRARSGG